MNKKYILLWKATAQAQADPRPAEISAQSLGFENCKPKLLKAEPKLGYAGRAEP